MNGVLQLQGYRTKLRICIDMMRAACDRLNGVTQNFICRERERERSVCVVVVVVVVVNLQIYKKFSYL